MDNQKTALVKSKSSNSTSEAKRNTQKNDKTSRSNAEFQPRVTTCMGTQPLMLKKRGVYVEKKPTKISINNTEPSPDVPSSRPAVSPPRPIPRPSKKRFLTSVLTILSKSTAGTQCPDETDGTRKMDKTKIKLKMRSDEEDIREEWSTSPNVSKRKNKYKSRILNNQSNKESFTVLQSKKDIAQTSSNNSEYINVKYDASSVDPETVKWAENLPPLENDSIVSVPTHSKKVRLIEKESRQSTAMVADTPKMNNKSFYDFFVDMLKTTMNVYNVETELDNQHLLTSANSSKVTLLEMKESVGRKKKIPKVEELRTQTLDISRKPSSQHAYSIMPDEKDEWTNRQLTEQFQMQMKNSPSPSKKRKRKLKSDSFQYKKTSPLPKTTSLPIPSKKKTTKKDPKKDFLKLLTDELEMKSDKFEEPENFYEALKAIARNKRRSQEWKYEIPSEEDDDHVCQFKRRNVLSRKSSAKQSSYYTAPPRSLRSTRQPSLPTSKKRKVIKVQPGDDTDYSNHSLEVFGYDYDTVKPPLKKPMNSTVSFISSARTPATALEDYSDEFWNDYSDSDTGPMFEQRKYVLDKLGQI